MKSFLYKRYILEAKLKALEKYGEGVTRRLLPKEINQEPEKWGAMPVINASWEPELWNFYGPDSFDDCIDIKSPYQVGDVCYFREAWRLEGWEDDAGGFWVGYRDGKTSECLCVTSEIADKYWLPNNIWPEQEWRNPYAMPEWAARHFVTVTEVTPERLDIKNLTPREIRLEGGPVALKFLAGYDGKWVFRIAYKRMAKP